MGLPQMLPDRRQAQRIALDLDATARQAGRQRTAVRVIDISTHGCRIEALTEFVLGRPIWLSVGGLESIFSRIAWQHGGFVGLEFGTPLSAQVLEHAFSSAMVSSETTVDQLQELARRARVARRRGNGGSSSVELIELSRDCAVRAIVTKLKLAEVGAHEIPSAPSTGLIGRNKQENIRPGFSFGLARNDSRSS